MKFLTPEQSHAHSLQTLNMLYEYDDFMMSIDTLVDLGCGTGLDLEWWATRTTRDENPIPLNIKCTGVDMFDQLPMARKYANIIYQKNNFEEEVRAPNKNKYDVLWCHDAFQYCINPINTLSSWRNISNPGAMLALTVPQTTNFEANRSIFTQADGCYYHYTLINLIHMLAVAGWDCASGFFLKRPEDSFIHAIVYNSNHESMNPKITKWYDLVEKNLLPESVTKSVKRWGELHYEDLVLPWLDRSLTWYGKQ